jgi:hypothetical protein
MVANEFVVYVREKHSCVETFLCFDHVLQYTPELWAGVVNSVDWRVRGAHC